jgi:hypothetical protein
VPVQGFLHNQPLVHKDNDGHLVVMVHVLLHYNSCDEYLKRLHQ